MSNDFISTGPDDYTITFGHKTTSMESYPEMKYDFSNLVDDDSDTITVTSSSDFAPTYTVDIGSISTSTADVVTLPLTYNIEQIKEMCTEYPALSKAYDNFKMIYEMVLQDWKGKQDVK